MCVVYCYKALLGICFSSCFTSVNLNDNGIRSAVSLSAINILKLLQLHLVFILHHICVSGGRVYWIT